MSALLRFVKHGPNNEKVPMRPRSVNITLEHDKFLNEHDLNLSMIVREHIDKLMSESKIKRSK